MNHTCPICAKHISKPLTQARSHVKSAHPEQKHYSTITRWLEKIGVKSFRPMKGAKQ